MIFVFLQSRHYGQCRYLIRIYITVFSEQERRLTSRHCPFYFRYVEFIVEIVVLRRTLSANYSIRAEDYFQSSIPFNHSESGRKEYYENMNISALFIENIPISCRKKGRPPISSRCFTKFNRDRNHNHDSAVPFFFLRFAEQVRE